MEGRDIEKLVREFGVSETLQKILIGIGDEINSRGLVHLPGIVEVVKARDSSWRAYCEGKSDLNADAIEDVHRDNFPAIYRLWKGVPLATKN